MDACALMMPFAIKSQADQPKEPAYSREDLLIAGAAVKRKCEGAGQNVHGFSARPLEQIVYAEQHMASSVPSVPAPPTQPPVLPPTLQRCIDADNVEILQRDLQHDQAETLSGIPPPPMHVASAVTLSLQASVPPPWEALATPAQSSPKSPPVPLSLCTSILPPTPVSIPSLQSQPLPASPAPHAPVPSSMPPSAPPSLPPMLKHLSSHIPSSPCWDAGCGNLISETLPGTPNGQTGFSGDFSVFKHAGMITPTTCSGSEIGSIGLATEEGTSHSSDSETDFTEGRSASVTPSGTDSAELSMLPPPGLEHTFELSSPQHMLSPHQKMSRYTDKAPARALCLDCLL